MQAVLFDLDGTLLDIDLPAFLSAYFRGLAAATGPHFPGVDVRSAVLASTDAMACPHPGLTNAAAFHADFLERTGLDLDDPDTYEVFETFYAEDFPDLRHGAGARPGARRAVETALDAGLSVVIATQPIFPRAAIAHRIAWAGLDDLGLEMTTYEVMHSCKPHPEYFREAAQMAGAEPDECVMVGDDRWLDMPAADVGMRTFYVGREATHADWTGDLDDFAELLERLRS
jgi:HAD superfamily hydrolase (TIGR01509 family)